MLCAGMPARMSCAEHEFFMIEAIRLQRFKGFLDSGWIELKPITLLFGYNSSGKSTILQALLMLKQTLESPAKEIPIIFSGNRVDLGTFYDVAHRHGISDETPIIFSLRINIEDYFEELTEQFPHLTYNNEENKHEREKLLFEELQKKSRIELIVSIRYDQKKKLNYIAVSIVSTHGEKNILSIENVQNNQLSFSSDFADGNYADGNYWIHKFDNDGERRMPIFDIEHFIPIISNYDYFSPFTSLIFTQVKKNINDTYQALTNIGPVRAIPSRIQQFTGERPFTVGAEGEDALKILYLSQYNHTFPSSLQESVNAWLASYNYRFQWKMLDENIGQVILTDMRTNLPVNLKDVGFGISQVLPIVIQVHAAPQHSIILIEQPEIHLHSRAQAELADLFIQAVASDGAIRKRLLIETHSETLLLRLRRRLAEHALNREATFGIAADDIAMYFIENENGQSVAHRIYLNEQGEFVDMPEGFRKFFTDDFEEMMALSMSLAKLKAGES